jgi:pimeloyl-ACP methyl ester carboxylesterase
MTFFLTAKGVISPGTAPTEKCVLATPRAYIAGTRTPVVLLQGHNGDALTPFSSLVAFTPGDAWGAVDAQLPVLTIDAGGGQTYGNDVAIARTVEAIDWLGGNAILLGTSMGSILGVNVAARYPARVRALGLIYPAMDLQYVHDNGTTAEVDAAYGGAFAANVASHSAIPQAAAGALNGMPIKGWHSSNDNVVGVDTWANFTAALAAGGAAAPDSYDLGAVGHGDNTLVPRGDVAVWLKAHA